MIYVTSIFELIIATIKIPDPEGLLLDFSAVMILSYRIILFTKIVDIIRILLIH